MSLEGAKFICLDEAGNHGEIVVAKGRKFTMGYYTNCDYIIADERAKGVHCEIMCDPFGRVTIRNFSADIPILINGSPVEIKRILLNNSKLSILDKEYLWQFTKSSSSELKHLCSEAVATPEKQIGIPEQPPNSCPEFKLHRELPKRFTVHNFAYCIQSDEEGNTSTDSNDESIIKDKKENPNKVKDEERVIKTNENQIEENDNKNSKDKENSNIARNRSVTPEPKEENKDNATALMETPKMNLINCTEDKENNSTHKKNKQLLTLCNQSDVVITSFSPRETGVKIEKSFAAVVKPKVLVTKPPTTPKSVYSTPKSEIQDEDDNDDEKGLIHFYTPSTSKKGTAEGVSISKVVKNSSMHLIDLTTPNKLRPASPFLKSALKASTKKNLTQTADKSSIKLNLEEQLGLSTLPSTPSINDSNKCSLETPSSVISVSSADSSSVVEVISDGSNITPSTVDGLRTPTKQQTRTGAYTPKRTPQSTIRKRAILTSAKKLEVTTPHREPINRIPLRNQSALLSTPVTPKASTKLPRRQSMSTPTRKSSARNRFDNSPLTSTSSPSSSISLALRRSSVNPISAARDLSTSTPVGSSSNSALHKVRKSVGGIPLSSHISKTRRSIALPATASKMTSLKEKSPQQVMSNRLVARARKSLSSSQPVRNMAAVEKMPPTCRSSILIDSKLERKPTEKRKAVLFADKKISEGGELDDLSRTFVVDSDDEENVEKIDKPKDATFSPDKPDKKSEETDKATINITFSPEKNLEKTEKSKTDQTDPVKPLEIPLDVEEITETRNLVIESEQNNKPEITHLINTGSESKETNNDNETHKKYLQTYNENNDHNIVQVTAAIKSNVLVTEENFAEIINATQEDIEENRSTNMVESIGITESPRDSNQKENQVCFAGVLSISKEDTEEIKISTTEISKQITESAGNTLNKEADVVETGFGEESIVEILDTSKQIETADDTCDNAKSNEIALTEEDKLNDTTSITKTQLNTNESIVKELVVKEILKDEVKVLDTDEPMEENKNIEEQKSDKYKPIYEDITLEGSLIEKEIKEEDPKLTKQPLYEDIALEASVKEETNKNESNFNEIVQNEVTQEIPKDSEIVEQLELQESNKSSEEATLNIAGKEETLLSTLEAKKATVISKCDQETVEQIKTDETLDEKQKQVDDVKHQKVKNKMNEDSLVVEQLELKKSEESIKQTEMKTEKQDTEDSENVEQLSLNKSETNISETPLNETESDDNTSKLLEEIEDVLNKSDEIKQKHLDDKKIQESETPLTEEQKEEIVEKSTNEDVFDVSKQSKELQNESLSQGDNVKETVVDAESQPQKMFESVIQPQECVASNVEAEFTSKACENNDDIPSVSSSKKKIEILSTGTPRRGTRRSSHSAETLTTAEIILTPRRGTRRASHSAETSSMAESTLTPRRSNRRTSVSTETSTIQTAETTLTPRRITRRASMSAESTNTPTKKVTRRSSIYAASEAPLTPKRITIRRSSIDVDDETLKLEAKTPLKQLEQRMVIAEEITDDMAAIIEEEEEPTVEKDTSEEKLDEKKVKAEDIVVTNEKEVLEESDVLESNGIEITVNRKDTKKPEEEEIEIEETATTSTIVDADKAEATLETLETKDAKIKEVEKETEQTLQENIYEIERNSTKVGDQEVTKTPETGKIYETQTIEEDKTEVEKITSQTLEQEFEETATTSTNVGEEEQPETFESLESKESEKKEVGEVLEETTTISTTVDDISTPKANLSVKIVAESPKTPIMRGICELFKNPEAEINTPKFVGIRNLVLTPKLTAEKEEETEKLAVVAELVKTSQATVSQGKEEVATINTKITEISTPKTKKTVKVMVDTPKTQTVMRELLKIPKAVINNPKLEGLHHLVRTLKSSAENEEEETEKLAVVAELIKTPQAAISQHLEEVNDIPTSTVEADISTLKTKKLVEIMEDSTKTPVMTGEHELIKTPKAEVNTPKFVGLRHLVRTPKSSAENEEEETEKLAVVAELVKTPQVAIAQDLEDTYDIPTTSTVETDISTPKAKRSVRIMTDSPKTPVMKGIRELLKTPKAEVNTPKLVGLRHLVRTPKSPAENEEEETEKLAVVAELVKTPQAAIAQDLEEAYDIPTTSTVVTDISTPKAKRSVRIMTDSPKTPVMKGIRELLKTSKAEVNTPKLVGLRHLVRTPKSPAANEEEETEKLAVVQELVKTPQAAISQDLEESNEILTISSVLTAISTPKAKRSVRIMADSPKTPIMTGMRELLKTPKAEVNTPKLVGLRHLLRTPKLSAENEEEETEKLAVLAELVKAPQASISQDLEETNDIPTTSTVVADISTPKVNKPVRIMADSPKTPVMTGMRELLKTPKAEENTPKLVGLSHLVTTPKSSAEDKEEEIEKLAAVAQLIKTPHVSQCLVEEDEPQSSAIDDEISTPNSKKSAKIVVDSPKTPTMTGMRELLKTPKSYVETPKFDGIRNLVQTPKPAVEYEEKEIEKMTGLDDLVKTPLTTVVTQDLEVQILEEIPTTSAKYAQLRGVKELLKTPKSCSTPRFKGMRELMQTPKMCSTPLMGGIKELMSTPAQEKHHDLSQAENDNLDKFLKTPTAKNIMIPSLPSSAVIEKSIDSIEVSTEYDLNATHEGGSANLEELFKTPVASRFVERITASYYGDECEERDETVDKFNKMETLQETRNQSAEEAFDNLVGQEAQIQTPIRNVFPRKSLALLTPQAQSPFSAADVLSDLPKTDIEEWIETLDQAEPPIILEGDDNEVVEIENENENIQAVPEEDDVLCLEDSIMDQDKNLSNNECIIPETCAKVYLSEQNLTSVTTTSEVMLNLSTIKKTSSKDPLASNTTKLKPKESRPVSPIDAEISGIDLLDQTVESVQDELSMLEEPLLMEEPSMFDEHLVVSDESEADITVNNPEETKEEEQVSLANNTLDYDDDDENDLSEPLLVSDSEDFNLSQDSKEKDLKNVCDGVTTRKDLLEFKQKVEAETSSLDIKVGEKSMLEEQPSKEVSLTKDPLESEQSEVQQEFETSRLDVIDLDLSDMKELIHKEDKEKSTIKEDLSTNSKYIENTESEIKETAVLEFKDIKNSVFEDSITENEDVNKDFKEENNIKDSQNEEKSTIEIEDSIIEDSFIEIKETKTEINSTNEDATSILETGNRSEIRAAKIKTSNSETLKESNVTTIETQKESEKVIEAKVVATSSDDSEKKDISLNIKPLEENEQVFEVDSENKDLITTKKSTDSETQIEVKKYQESEVVATSSELAENKAISEENEKLSKENETEDIFIDTTVTEISAEVDKSVKNEAVPKEEFKSKETKKDIDHDCEDIFMDSTVTERSKIDDSFVDEASNDEKDVENESAMVEVTTKEISNNGSEIITSLVEDKKTSTKEYIVHDDFKDYDDSKKSDETTENDNDDEGTTSSKAILKTETANETIETEKPVITEPICQDTKEVEENNIKQFTATKKDSENEELEVEHEDLSKNQESNATCTVLVKTEKDISKEKESSTIYQVIEDKSEDENIIQDDKPDEKSTTETISIDVIETEETIADNITETHEKSEKILGSAENVLPQVLEGNEETELAKELQDVNNVIESTSMEEQAEIKKPDMPDTESKEISEEIKFIDESKCKANESISEEIKVGETNSQLDDSITMKSKSEKSTTILTLNTEDQLSTENKSKTVVIDLKTVVNVEQNSSIIVIVNPSISTIEQEDTPTSTIEEFVQLEESKTKEEESIIESQNKKTNKIEKSEKAITNAEENITIASKDVISEIPFKSIEENEPKTSNDSYIEVIKTYDFEVKIKDTEHRNQTDTSESVELKTEKSTTKRGCGRKGSQSIECSNADLELPATRCGRKNTNTEKEPSQTTAQSVEEIQQLDLKRSRRKPTVSESSQGSFHEDDSNTTIISKARKGNIQMAPGEEAVLEQIVENEEQATVLAIIPPEINEDANAIELTEILDSANKETAEVQSLEEKQDIQTEVIEEVKKETVKHNHRNRTASESSLVSIQDDDSISTNLTDRRVIKKSPVEETVVEVNTENEELVTKSSELSTENEEIITTDKPVETLEQKQENEETLEQKHKNEATPTVSSEEGEKGKRESPVLVEKDVEQVPRDLKESEVYAEIQEAKEHAVKRVRRKPTASESSQGSVTEDDSSTRRCRRKVQKRPVEKILEENVENVETTEQREQIKTPEETVDGQKEENKQTLTIPLQDVKNTASHELPTTSHKLLTESVEESMRVDKPEETPTISNEEENQELSAASSQKESIDVLTEKVENRKSQVLVEKGVEEVPKTEEAKEPALKQGRRTPIVSESSQGSVAEYDSSTRRGRRKVLKTPVEKALADNSENVETTEQIKTSEETVVEQKEEKEIPTISLQKDEKIKFSESIDNLETVSQNVEEKENTGEAAFKEKPKIEYETEIERPTETVEEPKELGAKRNRRKPTVSESSQGSTHDDDTKNTKRVRRKVQKTPIEEPLAEEKPENELQTIATENDELVMSSNKTEAMSVEQTQEIEQNSTELSKKEEPTKSLESAEGIEIPDPIIKENVSKETEVKINTEEVVNRGRRIIQKTPVAEILKQKKEKEEFPTTSKADKEEQAEPTEGKPNEITNHNKSSSKKNDLSIVKEQPAKRCRRKPTSSESSQVSVHEDTELNKIGNNETTEQELNAETLTKSEQIVEPIVNESSDKPKQDISTAVQITKPGRRRKAVETESNKLDEVEQSSETVTDIEKEQKYTEIVESCDQEQYDTSSSTHTTKRGVYRKAKVSESIDTDVATSRSGSRNRKKPITKAHTTSNINELPIVIEEPKVEVTATDKTKSISAAKVDEIVISEDVKTSNESPSVIDQEKHEVLTEKDIKEEEKPTKKRGKRTRTASESSQGSIADEEEPTKRRARHQLPEIEEALVEESEKLVEETLPPIEENPKEEKDERKTKQQTESDKKIKEIDVQEKLQKSSRRRGAATSKDHIEYHQEELPTKTRRVRGKPDNIKEKQLVVDVGEKSENNELSEVQITAVNLELDDDHTSTEDKEVRGRRGRKHVVAEDHHQDETKPTTRRAAARLILDGHEESGSVSKRRAGGRKNKEQEEREPEVSQEETDTKRRAADKHIAGDHEESGSVSKRRAGGRKNQQQEEHEPEFSQEETATSGSASKKRVGGRKKQEQEEHEQEVSQEETAHTEISGGPSIRRVGRRKQAHDQIEHHDQDTNVTAEYSKRHEEKSAETAIHEGAKKGRARRKKDDLVETHITADDSDHHEEKSVETANNEETKKGRARRNKDELQTKTHITAEDSEHHEEKSVEPATQEETKKGRSRRKKDENPIVSEQPTTTSQPRGRKRKESHTDNEEQHSDEIATKNPETKDKKLETEIVPQTPQRGPRRGRKASAIDVDKNVQIVSENSDDSPSKRPLRKVATAYHNYDETSDSDKPTKTKKKTDSPRKSLETANYTPAATVTTASVTDPSPSTSSTPAATTARGRTRKPTARAQQFLEEERAKAETPKKRALLAAATAVTDTPTPLRMPGKRGRKASTIETDVDAVGTPQAIKRGRGKAAAAHNEDQKETAKVVIEETEHTTPPATTSAKGRRGGRKAKDTHHEEDAPPAKKSPLVLETEKQETSPEVEGTTPTRTTGKRNAAAAAKARIEEDALAAAAIDPPKRATKAKKIPTTKAAAIAITDAEGQSSEQEEDQTKTKTVKGTKNKNSSSQKREHRLTSASTVEGTEDLNIEEENEIDIEKPATKRGARKVAASTTTDSPAFPSKRGRKAKTESNETEIADVESKITRGRRNVKFDAESSTQQKTTPSVEIKEHLAASSEQSAEESSAPVKRSARTRRK